MDIHRYRFQKEVKDLLSGRKNGRDWSCFLLELYLDSIACRSGGEVLQKEIDHLATIRTRSVAAEYSRLSETYVLPRYEELGVDERLRQIITIDPCVKCLNLYTFVLGIYFSKIPVFILRRSDGEIVYVPTILKSICRKAASIKRSFVRWAEKELLRLGIIRRHDYHAILRLADYQYGYLKSNGVDSWTAHYVIQAIIVGYSYNVSEEYAFRKLLDKLDKNA